jgi:transcriptional regulator with XRE-family HTH domain
MNDETLTLDSDLSQRLMQMRQTVLSMLELIENEETSYADRKRATGTIRDALELLDSREAFGVRLDQLELGAASRSRIDDYAVHELDSQEAAFARKLMELMKARALTQAELASRIGRSQPAISQMLKRQCRPQRTTIINLAAALDVDARELWPNLDVTDILDTVAAVQEDGEMTNAEADALRRTLDKPAANAPASPLPSRKR